MNGGSSVNIENKFGETPLDKARPALAQLLKGINFIFIYALILERPLRYCPFEVLRLSIVNFWDLAIVIHFSHYGIYPICL